MYQVLIADGDPLMREALKLMVDRVDGFQVAFEVGDGFKAVELCWKNSVDIVFLDVMLPGLLGLDAAERIVSQKPKTTISIISAYSDFKFAREAMKLNIREYISKPVQFKMIKEALLSHRQEPNVKTIKHLELLFDIVKDRDLKRAYYELRPVATSIRFMAENSQEKLNTILNQIGRDMVDTLDAFEPERTSLVDLPPIKASLLSSDQSVELWLFRALDYVLWQKGLQRYSFLEKVYLFIEKRLQQNISLNDIVENCAVSQVHLSRIFRRQFKVSVMEYLHLKKLTLAKAYFTFTDQSASEVAFKLGYNESAYFSKVFKKYERSTVTQYKQQLGEVQSRPEADFEVNELLNSLGGEAG
jgi:two-component system response regulator YesN